MLEPDFMLFGDLEPSPRSVDNETTITQQIIISRINDACGLSIKRSFWCFAERREWYIGLTQCFGEQIT